MLLALVLAVLVHARWRRLDAVALGGLKLAGSRLQVSLYRPRSARAAIAVTYPKEAVVLFPPVIRALRALRTGQVSSVPRCRGTTGRSAGGEGCTYDLLEVLTEIGVVDLDGRGRSFGHVVSCNVSTGLDV